MLGIDWKNGQAGGTPLSAENLKLMQSLIETEIANQVQDLNLKINDMQETVLYNNLSGTQSQVPLSDDSTNYDYCEVFYSDYDNGFGSVKVFNPDGKLFNMFGGFMNTVWEDGNIKFEQARFQTDSIVREKAVQINFDTGSAKSATIGSARCKIYRVVGYKLNNE